MIFDRSIFSHWINGFTFHSDWHFWLADCTWRSDWSSLNPLAKLLVTESFREVWKFRSSTSFTTIIYRVKLLITTYWTMIDDITDSLEHLISLPYASSHLLTYLYWIWLKRWNGKIKRKKFNAWWGRAIERNKKSKCSFSSRERRENSWCWTYEHITIVYLLDRVAYQTCICSHWRYSSSI